MTPITNPIAGQRMASANAEKSALLDTIPVGQGRFWRLPR